MSSNRVLIDEVQADKAMSLKTWWALPFIQPLSRKLVVFVVNKTSFTPNHITFTAMFLRLVTALCFFNGSRSGLIIGAVAYYLAYVCDCADGTVARITNQTSELGRYLDHVADLIGDVVILMALSISQGVFGTYMFAGMFFIHIAECYMSYLAGFAINDNIKNASNPKIFQQFNQYRNWWFERNIKSFFSFPDYTALVFVFAPLFGLSRLGLQIGFWFLFIICLYTVFSTFVSIHCGLKKFP